MNDDMNEIRLFTNANVFLFFTYERERIANVNET